jgi:hypothetical protein
MPGGVAFTVGVEETASVAVAVEVGVADGKGSVGVSDAAGKGEGVNCDCAWGRDAVLAGAIQLVTQHNPNPKKNVVFIKCFRFTN